MITRTGKKKLMYKNLQKKISNFSQRRLIHIDAKCFLFKKKFTTNYFRMIVINF